MLLDDLVERYRFSKEGVRANLSLEYVCAHYGVELNKQGKAKCPFHEDHDPSFRLYMDDEGVQRWHCFPCQDGGDVFDLIGKFDHVSFGGAYSKATAMLQGMPAGWAPEIRLEAPAFGPNDWQEQVAEAIRVGASDRDGLAEAAGFSPELGGYLVEQWALGFATHPICGSDVTAHVLFPHFTPDGTLIGCKARGPDGSKRSLPGSKYIFLYGCWSPPVHPRSILLEGERDTIYARYRALVEGIPINVYGLPSGAGYGITQEQLSQLNTSTEVFTAFDADPAGDAASGTWRKALVDRTVRRCVLPPGSDVHDLGGTLADLLETAV